MKKVLFTVVLATFAIVSNAQIWMGGNVGFNVTSSKITDNSITSFNIQPTAGYTLNDKWDIALALNFESVSDSHNTFSIEPYARRTFLRLDKLSFFIDGALEIGSEKPNGGKSNFVFGIGVLPGMKFDINDRISLVAHVGSLGFVSVANSYDIFGLNVNNSALSFGMYWTL